MKILAKIQANISWEISSVPYVPALENVARHAENLLGAGVEGVMLGWTLGGHPSPNLEVVSGMRKGESADDAMRRIAVRRFGEELSLAVIDAWREFSAAYREYPFHINVAYHGPQQLGPANPLWEKPTGYVATMVGFPYDDLRMWRAIYPEETFIGQMAKVADGFDRALDRLRAATGSEEPREGSRERTALADEMRMAEAVSIHLRSVANQARFVRARDRLLATDEKEATRTLLDELEAVLMSEIALARQLFELQREDSRLGFEASNQYYYVPLDLAEKALNCHDLLNRWIPAERRARLGE
jgi:hypothetical protein